jgi:hypothetical protein
MTTPRKPTWWQLFTLLPALAGLFILEHHAALPGSWHMGVKVGIVCVIYFLVWRWLRFNTYALMTGPVLYFRHDYNGYDANGWAHTMNGDGTTHRGPAPHAMALDRQRTLAVARQAARQRGEDFAPRKRVSGEASRRWSKIA